MWAILDSAISKVSPGTYSMEKGGLPMIPNSSEVSSQASSRVAGSSREYNRN